MTSFSTGDERNGAPRRFAFLVLAVIGMLTLTACATTTAIDEAPAPSPFVEHGQ